MASTDAKSGFRLPWSTDRNEGDEQTETFVGRSQIEWPVAYLTLQRDGSDVITAV